MSSFMNKKEKIVTAIVLTIVVIAIIVATVSDKSAKWDKSELATLVSKPEFGTIVDVIDLPGVFACTVEDVTKDHAKKYIFSMKSNGFEYDAQEEKSEKQMSYEAFDKNKRSANCTYYYETGIMNIYVWPEGAKEERTNPIEDL